jgi:deazaflavin-dependent oxidoreductase (nitroreductase family)
MAVPTFVVRAISSTHAHVYRWTRGRVGGRLGTLEQVLLTTTGRRSGQARTIPLMVTPVGDRMVLIASFGGAPHHPAWYLNLVEHPEATIQRGGEVMACRTRTATGTERDELWRAAVAANPGYARYQEKTDRLIPVVVAERVTV